MVTIQAPSFWSLPWEPGGKAQNKGTYDVLYECGISVIIIITIITTITISISLSISISITIPTTITITISITTILLPTKPIETIEIHETRSLLPICLY